MASFGSPAGNAAPAPATGSPFTFGPSGATSSAGTTTQSTTGAAFSAVAGTASTQPAGSTSAPAANVNFSGAATGASPATTSGPTRPPSMTVPDYETIFTGQVLWNEIGSRASAALTSHDTLAGEELEYFVVKTHRDKLLNPRPLQIKAPDTARRQQLQQYPTVLFHGEEVTMTKPMLEQVLSLADNLHIAEEAALCLYAKASPEASRYAILDAIDSQTKGLVNMKLRHDEKNVDGHDIGQVARSLYFYELKLQLRTLLLLFQYRLNDSSGYIIRATDTLLQAGIINNLLALIREYTRLLDGMRQELARSLTPQSSTSSISVLDNFCSGERLAAAQALYFIAYHSQLEGQEVAAMIDLVRDLSDSMPVLDAIDDVPSAFHTSGDNTLGAPWFMNTTTPKREKEPFEWKAELVQRVWQSGMPQLLQCVSVVTMAILAALDTQSELMDRNTHAVNHFGQGNALLPPDSNDTRGLQPFHAKLSKSVEGEWKRTDVLGLLMAGYSLLLGVMPAATSSPRAGPTSHHGATGPIEPRKSWKECLVAATELKSITFAHRGLLPALETPNDSLLMECVPSEFLKSTLARFTSQYANQLLCSGVMPISRAKWEQDAAEELRINAQYQDEQRSFQSWAGTNAVELEQLPTSVDLSTRPDCMDDLIAFMTAVCSLGPEYAACFWPSKRPAMSQDDTSIVNNLDPSPALEELIRQQAGDETLRPSLLSFLAALATMEGRPGTESGASYIYRMLANGSGSKESWASLFGVLRYFIRELEPQASRGEQTSSLSATAYYYCNESGSDLPESSAFGGFQRDQSTANDLIQDKELGEFNTYLAMSILDLIKNVASSSVNGRLSLLSMTIPVQGVTARDNVSVGYDSSLMILFTFARQALSPEVRGAVFSAIATLLRTDDATGDEKSKVREYGLSAWQVLDACQILPIYIFDQFNAESSMPPETDSALGLAFPPSSSSMVKSNVSKSWISANKMYSIMYEMEHVESRLGVYPATEGLLRLLRSLFESAGSPSRLGESYRSRTGCTPYIEYVVSYVLRRAVGLFSGSSPLPFRCMTTKRRLVSLALEVANAVLIQYLLVEPSRACGSLEEVTKFACSEMKQQCTVHSIPDALRARCIQPRTEDVGLFSQDFDSSRGSSGYNGAPRLISPGLTVLAGILSPSGGELLEAITSALLGNDMNDAEIEGAGMLPLAFAAFNNSTPTFTATKSGNRSAVSKCTLFQSSEVETINASRHWRERCVAAALLLSCATVIREAAFLRMVQSLSSPITVVPALKFEERRLAPSLPIAIELQVTNLFQLLLRSNVQTGVMHRIIDLVGSMSLSDENDVVIPSAAIVLAAYVDRRSYGDPLGEVYRAGSERVRAVGMAYGHRLLGSFRHSISDKDHRELLRLLLEQIVVPLRGLSSDAAPIISTLLGPGALFNTIVHVLKKDAFVFTPETSLLAATCNEIIFRLYHFAFSCGDSGVVSLVADILRASGFWTEYLHQLTSGYVISVDAVNVYDEQVSHSLAWLLQSVSLELRHLACTQKVSFEQLVAFLLEPPTAILQKIIRVIPIERVSFESQVTLSEDDIRQAKVQLSGAPEVVSGYELIDFDRLVGVKCEEDQSRAWISKWNSFIRRDCATAHLSNALYEVLATINVVGMSCGAGKRAGGALLCQIIDRLVSDGVVRSGSMDRVCHATATRNLAHAALEASTRVKRIGDLSDTNALGLLVQAISFSGVSDRNVTVETRSIERTVLLAAALSELLTNDDFSDLWSDDIDLTEAGSVLVRLACLNIPSVPAVYTRIARICLTQLLDVDIKQTTKDFSVAFFLFDGRRSPEQQPIGLLMQRLTCGDRTATDIIQKLALLPLGGDALDRHNILGAVRAAAQQCMGATSGSRTMTSTEQLEYIGSHFRLMLSLMLAEVDDVQRRCATASRVMDILQEYAPLLEQIVARFPTESDILRSTLRCMSQAKTILVSCSELSNFADARPDPGGHLERFERNLVQRLMDMAEYPLPSYILPPLPPIPRGDLFGSTHGDPSAFSSKTWWDRLVNASTSNKELLAHASCAADILRTGLSSLAGHQCLSFLTIEQLARGICRCVESVKAIDKLGRQTLGVHGTEDAERVKAYIVDALSLLMSACLRIVQKIGEGQWPKETASNAGKTLSLTLDMSRLDADDIHLAIPYGGDENQSRPMFLKSLACALRKALANLRD